MANRVYRVRWWRGWAEDGQFYPSGVIRLWVAAPQRAFALKRARAVATAMVAREADAKGDAVQLARVSIFPGPLTPRQAQRVAQTMAVYRALVAARRQRTLDRRVARAMAPKRKLRARPHGTPPRGSTVDGPEPDGVWTGTRAYVPPDGDPAKGTMVALWHSKPWHVGPGSAWETVVKGVRSYVVERYDRRYRWDGGGPERDLIWRDREAAPDGTFYSDHPIAYGVKWSD